MTDLEVYKLWHSKTSDRRYLRVRRWNVLKKVIQDYDVRTILEFGSGVSTLLFDNLGLQIFSCETSLEYISFVKDLCSTKVHFYHWDNKNFPILSRYFDLALVDGIIPRNTQLDISLSRANLIAIDDFGGAIKRSFTPKLFDRERIDSGETLMAVFKAV